jgi:hypothetical protein
MAMNGLGFVANVAELSLVDDLPSERKVSLATNAALKALAVGSAASKSLGCSPKVQDILIQAESLGTVIGVSLEVRALVSEANQRGSWSWAEVNQLIGTVGGGVAKLYRLDAESTCLTEQGYVDMSDEERSKAKRPVYKYVEEGAISPEHPFERVASGYYECVGDRPVDKAESEGIVRQKRSVAQITGDVERAVTLVTGILSIAAFAIKSRQNRVPQTQDDIPAEFENDEILRNYICPISQQIIHDPVIDPTTMTLYERSYIEYWLDSGHAMSPLSKVHLTKEQLIPAPEAKKIIENRVRELQAEREGARQRMQAFLAHMPQERPNS